MGLLGRLFGSTYETVDVARARELLDGGAVLVDVRTAQEYRAGHAPAARHIPLDAIGTRQRELSKDRPVVTVCRSGARSANAARTLATKSGSVISTFSRSSTTASTSGRPTQESSIAL